MSFLLKIKFYHTLTVKVKRIIYDSNSLRYVSSETDDKRIMDCPRLDNIYVYPVEGNQKEIMIDSWIFYLIVFVFCMLAIYLQDIGMFK